MNARICLLAEHPEFIPTVGRWIFQEWGHHDPEETIESKTEEVKERITIGTLPLTFLALVGKELAGTASLIFDDLKGRPDLNPWLADVYVLPQHRKKGIASQLCRAAVANAAQLKVPLLYLFTKDQMKLYASLGWKEKERLFYRNEEVTVMTIIPSSYENL